MKYNNKQRAARVTKLLRHYARNDLPESCLIDFLADARHWCDYHDHCYGDLDRQAHEHYLVELGEESGGRP